MREQEKIAAAIQYDGTKDLAPRITAKGRGMIAEKIIALAREHNVPIKSDPVLVKMLSQLDLDDQIPLELYKAVAEILAFVYRANQEKGE